MKQYKNFLQNRIIYGSKTINSNWIEAFKRLHRNLWTHEEFPAHQFLKEPNNI